MYRMINDLFGCLLAAGIMLLIFTILLMLVAAVLMPFGIENEEVETYLAAALFFTFCFIFFRSKLWKGDS